MKYVFEGTLPSFLYILFLRECENVSDEHGERFHQDTISIESRYKGNESLVDFCLKLKRDTPEMFYKIRRKYKKLSFKRLTPFKRLCW